MPAPRWSLWPSTLLTFREPRFTPRPCTSRTSGPSVAGLRSISGSAGPVTTGTFRRSVGTAVRFSRRTVTDHIQGATQRSWSPRLYFTYDVTGNGKTALKGGWGRFSDWRNGNHVLPLNPNVALQRRYRWTRSNGNGDYDPGEVNLATTSNPDFIEEVGRGNAAIANVVSNPDQPQTKEDQFSLSLERELMANFAVRVTGLYSRRFDVIRSQNLRRGPEIYTIANTRPDPGPDGRVGTADDPAASSSPGGNIPESTYRSHTS